MLTKVLSVLFLAVAILATTGWIYGSVMSRPNQHEVIVPRDLNAEPVTFQSLSGSTLHGSWIEGEQGKAVIILMHGIRADRLALSERAQFLKKLGYTILMFDFQAHGESLGDQITFGYLESKDAHGAVAYVKQRTPNAKVGAIGISLGGAAAVLGDQPLPVDALVLESVFSSIETAIFNRIHMRLGSMAQVLTPLMMMQLHYRLGIQPRELSPVKSISRAKSALLILSGTDDLHTTKADTKLLFEEAREPKALIWFEGAEHVDLMTYDLEKYSQAISDFFSANLKSLKRNKNQQGAHP